EVSFQLVLFEADRLRAKRIPSFQPPQQGGMTIPMTLTEEDDVTEDMTMDFVIDEGSSEVSLEISWGPFTLAAPVVAEIPTEERDASPLAPPGTRDVARRASPWSATTLQRLIRCARTSLG